MTDVAREAGVSLKTVSRVINNEPNVRPEMRERVTAALRATGYRRNEVARSLVTGTTRTIALLLPNVTNPIYSEFVGGVQAVADRRGYTVLLLATQRDAAREERYFELLSTRRSDGAILVNTVSGKARITELSASGVRLVAALDTPAHIPSVPHVGFDERRAAADIVRHLLNQGHRSVAHLAGTPSTPTAKAVAVGYRAALRQAGIPYDDDLVLAGDFTEEAGWHGVQHLLKTGQRFTAVFAGNDLTAIGALAALCHSGLSVPADVSVAGIDDIRFASYTNPTLTTVHQPASDIGQRATEMLLDQLAPDSSHVSGNAVFRGRLVLRNSVAPPPCTSSKSDLNHPRPTFSLHGTRQRPCDPHRCARICQFGRASGKVVRSRGSIMSPGRLRRVDLVEVPVPHIAAVGANPLDQAGALRVAIECLDKLALPRESLISPIGQHFQQFATPNALQCYAGHAPVTRRSGRSEFTIARRLAYNRHLGEAVPQWAFCSLARSAWAREFYDEKPPVGGIHHAALGKRGNRWLEILRHCLRKGVLHDEAVHAANRKRSQPPPAAAA